MNATNSFKLTYSTMFDPPAELHQRFDHSLAKTEQALEQKSRDATSPT
jgi:hypothetical protein